jgi:hypothetical protein
MKIGIAAGQIGCVAVPPVPVFAQAAILHVFEPASKHIGVGHIA